jgi:hypothetical protein
MWGTDFFKQSNSLAKNFGQELATLILRHSKSFCQPLQVSAVTPSRVQVASCTVLQEKALVSLLYVVHVLASFPCNKKWG